MRRPSRPLAAALAALAAGAATVGVAQATRGDDPPPPDKPLISAVLDSLSAPAPRGIVADVEITNNLLPDSASIARLAGVLRGRLVAAPDSGLRLTLDSDAGAVEVIANTRGLTVYDERSNTAYTVPLALKRTAELGAVAPQMLRALARTFSVGEAVPGRVAGRPAYSATIRPRDDGGLLGSAEFSWDAERPIPLRFALFAQGSDDPALEIELTDVSYEPVRPPALAPTLHPGVRRIELESGGPAPSPAPSVAGLPAVQQRLDFQLAAPEQVAGLPRTAVRLIRSDAGAGALVTYGRGLGAVVVTQWRSDSRVPSAPDANGLPRVNIDGATGVELANPLGTALLVRRDGVNHLVSGLVPPVVVERVARDLR
jgi:hypothetical protein